MRWIPPSKPWWALSAVLVVTGATTATQATAEESDPSDEDDALRAVLAATKDRYAEEPASSAALDPRRRNLLQLIRLLDEADGVPYTTPEAQRAREVLDAHRELPRPPPPLPGAAPGGARVPAATRPMAPIGSVVCQLTPPAPTTDQDHEGGVAGVLQLGLPMLPSLRTGRSPGYFFAYAGFGPMNKEYRRREGEGGYAWSRQRTEALFGIGQFFATSTVLGDRLGVMLSQGMAIGPTHTQTHDDEGKYFDEPIETRFPEIDLAAMFTVQTRFDLTLSAGIRANIPLKIRATPFVGPVFRIGGMHFRPLPRGDARPRPGRADRSRPREVIGAILVQAGATNHVHTTPATFPDFTGEVLVGIGTPLRGHGPDGAFLGYVGLGSGDKRYEGDYEGPGIKHFGLYAHIPLGVAQFLAVTAPDGTRFGAWLSQGVLVCFGEKRLESTVFRDGVLFEADFHALFAIQTPGDFLLGIGMRADVMLNPDGAVFLGPVLRFGGLRYR